MRYRMVLMTSVAVVAHGMSSMDAAQPGDEARALVAKAAKAMGGDDKDAKFEGMRTKAKGKLHVGGGIAMEQTVLVRYPNQFRERAELDVNNQKVVITTVYDGKNGWLDIDGKIKDLDDKIAQELKEVGALLAITRLTTLLDKKYELAVIGEAKVEGKPALGLRVSGEGFRPFNLYFDKQNHTMVKLERRAVDPMSGQEVDEERLVLSYKDKNGLKAPEKILIRRDGKLFLEAEILEYERVERVDPAEFVRPKD